MNKALSEYFGIVRRYFRSINIERDLDKIDALKGYILTERSVDAARRILSGLIGVSDHRAWTLTSVYGTGKSAFALFLASLCAPENSDMRQMADNIAAQTFSTEANVYLAFQENIPKLGLFRAVATAGREPLSNTIVRALLRGAEDFWSPRKFNKLEIAQKLADLDAQVAGGKTVDSREIPKLVKEIAEAASTSILLIIDELGKNLEFAVHNQGAEDLYLLQQLAELPQSKNYQVYIVGILHASFADYGERLASVQRNEWAKIQGRFEDIPFQDSPAQMMRLIGQVIDREAADKLECGIHNQATEWFESLPEGIRNDYTLPVLKDSYPLHPITALVLPMLCTRYAQNDRSLFTFLTSAEPYSFKHFLADTTVETDVLPTLKLDRIYDYFIEAVGYGLASRPNLQRWVEIQNLITDAKHLELDSLRVLKAIGILNLVTTTGAMRATRTLVTLSLCNIPSDNTKSHWGMVIDDLLQKGIITYRRQLDELRIWQGSDFNVDIELANYIEQERSPLLNLVSSIRPLTPIVAQRHSYKTGTTRYFERRYLDGLEDLTKINCSKSDCDGLVGYWVDEAQPKNVPPYTVDKRYTDGQLNRLYSALKKKTHQLYCWDTDIFDSLYHTQKDWESLYQLERPHALEGIAKKIDYCLQQYPDSEQLRIVIASDHGQMMGILDKITHCPPQLEFKGRMAIGKTDDSRFVVLESDRYGLPHDISVIKSSASFSSFSYTTDKKIIGSHGGLFPEEVIVGVSVLRKSIQRRPVLISCHGEGEPRKPGELEITIDNPNSVPLRDLFLYINKLPSFDLGKPLEKTIPANKKETFKLTIPEIPELLPDDKNNEFLLSGQLTFLFANTEAGSATLDFDSKIIINQMFSSGFDIDEFL